MVIWITLLLLQFYFVHSHQIVDQKCSDVITNDFTIDPVKLLGIWYESDSYGIEQNCTRDLIKHVTRRPNRFNIIRTNQQTEKNESLHIIIDQNHIAGDVDGIIMNHNIEDYIIIWSCRPTNQTSSEQVLIILTRNVNNSAADYLEIGDILNKAHIDTTPLQRLEQNPLVCNKVSVQTINLLIVFIVCIAAILF